MLNNYLLQKLFVDKEENGLYKRWFPKIWGQPDLFKDFLELASTQSQKTLAMDIVRQIASVSDFSVPHSAFVNLIEIEHKGDDWGWINQEHAVHSVNVYICGIFLFFFYPPLRQELLWYFGKLSNGECSHQSPLDEAIDETIRCLRIAAFYHDLGYVLERTVDLTGKFNPGSGICQDDLLVYQHIDLEVIYDVTKKVLSHFFLAQGILYQEQVCLNDILKRTNWIVDKSLWQELHTNTVLYGSEIKIKLESMCNMSQLKHIQSWEGMKYLVPYLSGENVLTMAVDSQFRPAIIYFGLPADPIVYYRHDLRIEQHFLLHISEMKPAELNQYV